MIVTWYFRHSFADLARLQRIRVVGNAKAGNGGQPQPDGKSEGVEKRQNPQQAIGAVHVDRLLHGLQVRDNVAVAQHHALGHAGAAAGKNDRSQRIELDLGGNQRAPQQRSGNDARHDGPNDFVELGNRAATSSIITMPGCFSMPSRLKSFSVVKMVFRPARSTATSIACFDEV